MMWFFFHTDTEACKKFSETLRRIVRSFDRAEQGRITMAYVKTSLHKKRFVRIDFNVWCIIDTFILDWSVANDAVVFLKDFCNILSYIILLIVFIQLKQRHC